MALIQAVRAIKRPEYLRRSMMVSHYRGSLRASAWPRPRPARPSSYQQSLRDNLKRLVHYMRYLIPREVVPTRDAIDRHNRRVRGHRGSAAIRYRDWEVQRLSGHLFMFILPDGTKVVSTAVRQDVSDQLDWASDQPRTLLIRGQHHWEGLDISGWN